MDSNSAPAAIPALLASRDEVLASVAPAVGRRAADVWQGGKLSDVSFREEGWTTGEAKCLGSNPGEAYTHVVALLLHVAQHALLNATPPPALPPLPPVVPHLVRHGRSANGVCKHVVALLLERSTQLSSMPPVSSTRVPASTAATSLHAADTSAPAADMSAPGRDTSASAPVSPPRPVVRGATRKRGRVLPAWMLVVKDGGKGDAGEEKGAKGDEGKGKVEKKVRGKREKGSLDGGKKAGTKRGGDGKRAGGVKRVRRVRRRTMGFKLGDEFSEEEEEEEEVEGVTEEEEEGEGGEEVEREGEEGEAEEGGERNMGDGRDLMDGEEVRRGGEERGGRKGRGCGRGNEGREEDAGVKMGAKGGRKVGKGRSRKGHVSAGCEEVEEGKEEEERGGGDVYGERYEHGHDVADVAADAADVDFTDDDLLMLAAQDEQQPSHTPSQEPKQQPSQQQPSQQPSQQAFSSQHDSVFSSRRWKAAGEEAEHGPSHTINSSGVSSRQAAVGIMDFFAGLKASQQSHRRVGDGAAE
ncbi:unnamed protein product [Closterium sp. Yama58-4]|nr:unnamed protein product [Closterium sp. Yama58-4]